RVWAGDDTKVHRNSPTVWGTCTFHEYTARCPNRATTVRAHNWVVLGGLAPNAEQPATFMPVAGRLYFRQESTAGWRDIPHQVRTAGRDAARTSESARRAAFSGV